LLTQAAAATGGNTHEYTLDNGLHVIVRTDRRAPVAVSQLWYHVGSSYEHAGITGISHVLEHMMFKGTKKHPPGEFSQIISDNGGEQNAFTSHDFTAYYEQLASDRLDVAFRLEADRMHNLKLEEQQFAKELQVVREERRLRIEDQPQSLLSERFDAVAYMANPYSHPVIGWPGDLKVLNVQDLKHWYQRWYAPNNATLVVAGDVDPDAVRDLAAKYFGDIPASGHPAPPGGETGIPAPGRRDVTLHLKEATTPYLIMGYSVPSLATADDPKEAYALDVLSMALDGGAGALLPQRLVRGASVAASVGAGYDPVNRLDTLFMFDGVPALHGSLDKVQSALQKQIEQVRSKPLPPDAIDRAKTQLLADHVYRMDSVFYQAMQIGRLEATGIGWQALEHYQDAVQSVTAKQIQAAARKYFTPDRLTVARLLPAGGNDQSQPKETH